MKIYDFVKMFMKPTARLTICKRLGDIIYEGEVSNLNVKLLKLLKDTDAEVLSVKGIGSQNDLIITTSMCNNTQGYDNHQLYKSEEA